MPPRLAPRGRLVGLAGLAVALIWAGWGQSPPPVGPVPPPDDAPTVYDGNLVPAAVLELLPGIGPVLAGRIVAERTRRPFDSLDDLDRRVKGIGPVKAAGLRPHLRFDPAGMPTPSP